MRNKLVIFDLDGVLVETKHLHEIAFLKAVNKCCEPPVTKEEHATRLDGLPTSVKLDLLIREGRVDPICRKAVAIEKQVETTNLLRTFIGYDADIYKCMKRFKDEGWKIAICSNAIRATVEVCVQKRKIEEFVDVIFSNEDIEKGKPDPEMYLKAMAKVDAKPEDTIIIEDSAVGIKGALASGGYTITVDSPLDVSEALYKVVTSLYNKHKTKAENLGRPLWRPQWRQVRPINILVPMAGAGSRFAQEGYVRPKPFIETRFAKRMIQHVIESLGVAGHFIFLVRKEHLTEYDFTDLLKEYDCPYSFVEVNELTEGAACTTLLAKLLINNDEELLIVNADQYLEWDAAQFMYLNKRQWVDGSIVTFDDPYRNPKWSYARPNDKGLVVEVAEKNPISTKATVGAYYWRRGCDYVRFAEEMISKNIRTNGEFYVCPVFNQAIEAGRKITLFDVEKMWGMGTPQDLQFFETNYRPPVHE